MSDQKQEKGEPHLPKGSNTNVTKVAPPSARKEEVPQVGSMPVPYEDDDPKYDANRLRPRRR